MSASIAAHSLQRFSHTSPQFLRWGHLQCCSFLFTPSDHSTSYITMPRCPLRTDWQVSKFRLHCLSGISSGQWYSPLPSERAPRAIVLIQMPKRPCYRPLQPPAPQDIHENDNNSRIDLGLFTFMQTQNFSTSDLNSSSSLQQQALTHHSSKSYLPILKSPDQMKCSMIFPKETRLCSSPPSMPSGNQCSVMHLRVA